MRSSKSERGELSTHFAVWGNNNENLISQSQSQCITRPEQIFLPHAMQQMTATEKHVSFIADGGHVYSYGSNSDGRLGITEKQSFRTQQPIKVQLPSKAVDIKSGFSHVCVRLQNNELYAWGLGQYGSLGTGELRSKSAPARVKLDRRVRQISCGAMHSAFVDYEGQLFMCGSNEYGELGIGSCDKVSVPTLVHVPERVKEVACGVFYTLILTESGKVYGMGNNKYAQLGLGHKNNQNVPSILAELANIRTVEAGYHSGALNHNGELYLWGSGSFGEILRPKRFLVHEPLDFLQIRGFFGVAANRSLSKVYIWGNNTHGQLGNGGYISCKSPTEIDALKKFKVSGIFCGINFVMAMINDHSRRQSHLLMQSPVHNLSSRTYGYSSNSLQGSPQKYQGDPQVLTNRLAPQHRANSYENRTVQRASLASQEYEVLFLRLSEDYEILAEKYRELELEITNRELSRSRRDQIFNLRSNEEKKILEEHISHLKRQLAALKDELSLAEIRNSSAPRPTVSANTSQVESQITEEYKRIIAEKEALVRELFIQKQALLQQLAKEQDSAQSHRTQLNDSESLRHEHSMEVSSLKEMLVEEKNKNLALQEEIRRCVSVKEYEAVTQRLLEYQSLLEKEKGKLEFNEVEKTNEKLIMAALETEKSRLLELVQNLKSDKFQIEKAYKQELAKSEAESQNLLEKVNQLQSNLHCEKEFIAQLEEGKVELEKLRAEACAQLEKNNEILAKEKSRRKQLERDAEKAKLVESELKVVKDQLEKERDLSEEYKTKMMREYKRKEQLVKQMQTELEAKQAEFGEIIQKKQNEIERHVEDRREVEKRLETEKLEIRKLNKSISIQEDQSEQQKDAIEKLERKLKHAKQQAEKQIREREELTEEIGEVKRDQTRMVLEREALQKNYYELEKLKFDSDNNAKRKEERVKELEAELQQLDEVCQNLRLENGHMKSELDQANSAVEEANRISEELSDANREFAQNEESLNKKLEGAEAKVYELEDENRSYAPRYDALLERNRELDRRNNELSEMVNKAIEVQAETFKTNILKEVQINTSEIIEQAEDEQKFKQRFNRKEEPDSRSYAEGSENDPNASALKGSQEISQIQEPYTKYMNQKIQSHQRKVSASAQKLADILDLNQGNEESVFGGTMSARHDRDLKFEQINDQMESLKSQKEMFMEKINSFASKMKLL